MKIRFHASLQRLWMDSPSVWRGESKNESIPSMISYFILLYNLILIIVRASSRAPPVSGFSKYFFCLRYGESKGRRSAHARRILLSGVRVRRVYFRKQILLKRPLLQRTPFSSKQSLKKAKKRERKSKIVGSKCVVEGMSCFHVPIDPKAMAAG